MDGSVCRLSRYEKIWRVRLSACSTVVTRHLCIFVTQSESLRVGFAILTCVCVKPGHLWYRSASVPPMNQFNDDSKLFSDGLLGGWLSG